MSSAAPHPMMQPHNEHDETDTMNHQDTKLDLDAPMIMLVACYAATLLVSIGWVATLTG